MLEIAQGKHKTVEGATPLGGGGRAEERVLAHRTQCSRTEGTEGP